MGVTMLRHKQQFWIARRFGLALLAASSLLLCSCKSLTADANLAEQGAAQFHSQLDAEQYAALYAAADSELHKATGQNDFVKFLTAVHRKLGNVKQSNLRAWNASWHTGQGTLVTLTYDTTFSAGSGSEQFVWRISDNRALLYGYHINSADLIEK